MNLDVAFAPHTLGPAEVAGRTVFVIDVLRATTTICAALAHGARSVIPAASGDEAARLAQSIGHDEVLLAGERGCVRMPGFDLGNSPLEMTPAVVAGRVIVQSTTNGTGALLAAQHARAVHVAAAVNLAMAAERGREALAEGGSVLLLCAGREGGFSLDDAYCAGRLIVDMLSDGPSGCELGDAARASVALVNAYGDAWLRVFGESAAGRMLVAHGFAADLEEAARTNAYPVLPSLNDRRLTAASLATA